MAANTLDHLRRVDEEAGERLRMQPRDVIPLEEGVGQQLPVRVQLEVVRLENMHLRDADRIEIMQQFRTDGLGIELGLTVETDPDQATTLEAGQLSMMVVLLVEILDNFLGRNAAPDRKSKRLNSCLY